MARVLPCLWEGSGIRTKVGRMDAQDNGSEVPAAALTREQLQELESRPQTRGQRIADRVIALLPTLAGVVAILEYLYLPNAAGYRTTYVYVWFLGIFTLATVVFYVVGLVNRKAFARLRYKAPFYVLLYCIFIAYDLLTNKTGSLLLPFFPSVDDILNAALSDTAYLTDCAIHSLQLLFTGYGWGVVIGLVTGIACGYSRKVDYWISPFMKVLGAIPSTTWIPVVMVLATTLFQGAVFIIALGVWFSVTIATISGIHGIDRSYYEAARTLGATSRQLVTKVAIPSALPSIFQGLTQAMSTACTALIVAEMMGVESGLGWYITWQRNWATYDKMYAAIVIICLVFVAVNFILNRISHAVLRWQDGMVKD